MNKSLIQTYVAYKVAFSDLLLAEAKRVMKKEDFIKKVMNMPLKEVNPDLISAMETTFRRRFLLNEKSYIFKKPTVAQWIKDVFGDYTPDDILTAFTQMTNLSEKAFRGAKLSDTLLDASYLLDIVENFERATGHFILAQDSYHPDLESLDYLGEDFTYEELARYFAGDKATEEKVHTLLLETNQIDGKCMLDAMDII